MSRIYDFKSMELYNSRGYEDPSHKVFMRATVLISDIIFFFSAVIALINLESKKYSLVVRGSLILFALCSPPFMLIDHGHF